MRFKLKDRPQYAVFIHRLYTSDGQAKVGGLDIILDEIAKRGRKILYVESPLLPRRWPYVTVSLRSGLEKQELAKIKFITYFSPIARLQELLILLFLPVAHKLSDIPFITSDPLTTAPVVLLRKFGFIKFSYYHCIDYSEKRFPNSIYNYIYKAFLWYSLKGADLVGCVTRRMQAFFSDRGVKRLVYIPNSANTDELSTYRVPIEARVKHRLVVTCSGISHKYRIKETLDLLCALLQVYKDVSLVFIGSTEFEPEEFEAIKSYSKSLGVNEKVKFLGQLSKEQNFIEVGKSYVGLAFYDKSYSHVNFGDSLKIREYAALGIPIVADCVTSTAEEMAASDGGTVVNSPQEASAAIKRLFDDTQSYRQFSEKALAWAVKTDKSKIVDDLITNYLEK